MFQISERDHVGLILMTELAHQAEEFTSLKDIAERMKLSLGYLEEIAMTLKRANLIEGKTGPGGGYRLMKKPDEITAEKILSALAGPLMLVACQKGEGTCPAEGHCSSRSFWKKIF
jgi:Rrf2 family protein